MGLTTKILAGLILGVAAGLGLGQSGLPFATTWIAPLGAIFMNMIKMIIVPLVFSSLVLGVAGLGDIKKIGCEFGYWKEILYDSFVYDSYNDR